MDRQPTWILTRFAYWAAFPKWTWTEAPALVCGLDPDYARETWSHYGSRTRSLPSNLQAAYADTRRLIERAMPPRWRLEGATPAQWVALAKKHGLSIPQELEAAVANRADVSAKEPTPEQTDTWDRERDAWKVEVEKFRGTSSASEQSTPLKRLSNDQIRSVLRDVYAEAKTAGKRPPNVNEATKDCAGKLKESGYQASHALIRPIAEEPEFKDQRLKAGERFK
jgi:hypothetical protein